MKPSRRLLALLALPSLAALVWVLVRPSAVPPRGPWVVHENVLVALQDGELVRTTEVLEAGTLRGQAQTIEVDPRRFSAAEGMLSNPLGQPPYAWCVGTRTDFELDVLEPLDRRLRVELGNGTSSPQRVSLVFNGLMLAEQDLPVGSTPITLVAEVPAAAQLRGVNRVQLLFAQTEMRQLIGQPTPLPIAAVLTHAHFLRTGGVERLPDAPPPLGLQTDTSGAGSRAVLVLPPGTSARVPLRLPPSDRVALRLRVERLGLPLEVWAQRDSGARTRLARVESEGFTPRELQLDLSDWSGQPILLDFWAHDGSAAPAQISAAAVIVPQGWEPPAAVAPAPEPAPAARRSFLLVTLDAFSRRQLDGVGQAQAAEIAPRLAELGARATRFRDATAPASYTLTSVASLLTGQSPPRHGVALAMEARGPGRLREGAPRLARALAEQGWRTAAFVTNPNAAARHGYDAGFELYDELFRDESLWDEGVAGEHLPPRLTSWLAAAGEAPVFAWVHVFEPHAPYVAPPDLLERWVRPYDGPVRGDRAWIDAFHQGEVDVDKAGWVHLRQLYAARMALADRTLGALLDALQAAGRADETVVIVTADHGEALGEHGTLEHGDTVHGEQVDVPLVVYVPGRAPAVVAGPVTLADIAPTVLALAGVAPPAGMDGVDLLAAAPDPLRPFVARSSERLPKLSWTRGGLRLVVDLATRRRQLFDLSSDPSELTDLWGQRPATAALLYRELSQAICAAEAERAATAAAEPAPAPDDPVLREQLQTIGYVAPAAGSGEADDDPAQDPSNCQCELLRARLRRT